MGVHARGPPATLKFPPGGAVPVPLWSVGPQAMPIWRHRCHSQGNGAGHTWTFPRHRSPLTPPWPPWRAPGTDKQTLDKQRRLTPWPPGEPHALGLAAFEGGSLRSRGFLNHPIPFSALWGGFCPHSQCPCWVCHPCPLNHLCRLELREGGFKREWLWGGPPRLWGGLQGAVGPLAHQLGGDTCGEAPPGLVAAPYGDGATAPGVPRWPVRGSDPWGPSLCAPFYS